MVLDPVHMLFSRVNLLFVLLYTTKLHLVLYV